MPPVSPTRQPSSALISPPFPIANCKVRSRTSRAKLRAAGFDQNARIAVAIANPAQAALAIVAISCSATAVPIDPKLTIPEVNRCLQILRPDAVLVLRDTASADAQRRQRTRRADHRSAASRSRAGFRSHSRCRKSVRRCRRMSRMRTRLSLSCTRRERRRIPISFPSAIATCWRSSSVCRHGSD